MRKLVLLPAVIVMTATATVNRSYAQQVADPNFDAKVAHPAYAKTGPKVLFDEAHNNFHTASGRYKPFADLVASDGYRVAPNREAFTKEGLRGCDILVIANAVWPGRMAAPDRSAPVFTEAECAAVRGWVKDGG